MVSSGPRWGHGRRWPGPGRSGWIAILLLGGVLACLGLTMILALQVAHQSDTINKLHAAARNARQPAPAAAALPAIEASVAYTLPDAADGSFSVVAVSIQPKPGSAVLTWLFVYARHGLPGERYGLRQATCTGQHVTASDRGRRDRRPGRQPHDRGAQPRLSPPTKVPGLRYTGGRERHGAGWHTSRSAGRQDVPVRTDLLSGLRPGFALATVDGVRQRPFGLHHAGETGGGDAERQLDPFAEHLPAGVDGRDIAQDGRVELQFGKGASRPGQGDLGFCGAVCVVERGFGCAPFGDTAQVGDGRAGASRAAGRIDDGSS